MARTKPPTGKKADAILVGDIHATLRQPICRMDDFGAALFGKLSFLRSLQAKHDNCLILQPGDFFDRWYLDRGEQWLLTRLIDVIKNWICIPGQHDLPQHNLGLYHRSNLAVLEEAGCVKVFKNEMALLRDRFGIQGFGWGRSPRENWETNFEDGGREVALIHRMTYLNKPPYPGAEESGGTAEQLMRQMKGFDLIVVGDNHETFTYEEGGRWLVNPGSLMRLTAKQADHRPVCFLWFADTNSISRVEIPHHAGVVSREHIDQSVRRDERLQAFVEHLQGEVDLELSYEENVKRYMAQNKTPEPVREIVREVIE
jgi:predicted phosphodiesterase